MKIKKIVISNFRAFKHAEIDFDDFNCIIGKNDTGKSTILTALDWFFDSKKILDENDFAAAGFDWAEYEHPSYYDEITGEMFMGETVKEFIYDGFCISVDVYFCDANLPNRTVESGFIFSKDYMSKDGDICISKYMCHPHEDINHPSNGIQMGYCIKEYYFEKVGKPFSDCTIEELKTAYNEIGKNADELCEDLHHLEKECKSKKRGIALSAVKAKIRDEEAKIKEKISAELYKHYNSTGEKICDEKWLSFDDINDIEFHFGLTFPKYALYTSKTPINDYLNDLFTPYNAGIYKSIEGAKVITATKLSELLNLEGRNEKLDIKKNEKIDLFTHDSLVFQQKDLPLRIPLKNRGEGLQLKIKNAVFRLLTEIQTKNQINTIFAFEEPETHLHPSAQIEMYETIKALSEKADYQVIITTHSPFIVKELAKNDILPIVVKREQTAKESRISKLDESVLPYNSMNEINYIAFDEPSVEYHIELFGFMQNKLNKNKVQELDDWLKNGGIVKDSDLFDWYDTKKLKKTDDKKTLPYCVRNNIDHPLVDDVSDSKKHNAYLNNSQFDNKDLIRKSIEIMRDAIINNKEFR
ncbi:MAG: AAA family ATPase [Bacteroidales bacterium]|nr:AAA family ATPase [Bacteroidales bacterium]